MTTVILSLLASLFLYTSPAQHPYTCCYNIYIYFVHLKIWHRPHATLRTLTLKEVLAVGYFLD